MGEVTLEFIGRQLERLLEGQRRLESSVEEMRIDMREAKVCLTALETLYASFSFRVDRLDQRLERVERRLDLREAHEPA